MPTEHSGRANRSEQLPVEHLLADLGTQRRTHPAWPRGASVGKPRARLASVPRNLPRTPGRCRLGTRGPPRSPMRPSRVATLVASTWTSKVRVTSARMGRWAPMGTPGRGWRRLVRRLVTRRPALCQSGALRCGGSPGSQPRTALGRPYGSPGGDVPGRRHAGPPRFASLRPTGSPGGPRSTGHNPPTARGGRLSRIRKPR